MPMKTKLKPTRLFFEIQRVDDGHPDYSIVEGYAYVNARVASDRYNLTRGAMEEASRSYLQFPAVREMHASSAAGTGLEVVWDERGARLTAKVVDPVARLKVKEGVYRGFSVGVTPLVVRGDEVTKCAWVETSLVDRPADPDAVFTVVRAEALPDEVEVDVEPDANPSEEALQRMSRQISALENERDASRTEIARVQGLLKAAEGRIAELEAMPATPVVRFTQGLQREFLANAEARSRTDELRQELARIEAMTPEALTALSNRERQDLALRVSILKTQISQG